MIPPKEIWEKIAGYLTQQDILNLRESDNLEDPLQSNAFWTYLLEAHFGAAALADKTQDPKHFYFTVHDRLEKLNGQVKQFSGLRDLFTPGSATRKIKENFFIWRSLDEEQQYITMNDIAAKYKMVIDGSNNDKGAMLMQAACQGYHFLVKDLIEAGANVNYEVDGSINGNLTFKTFPFHQWCYCPIESALQTKKTPWIDSFADIDETIKLLLAKGLNVESRKRAMSFISDNYHCVALHPYIGPLLNTEPSIKEDDYYVRAPFGKSAVQGNLSYVTEMLKHGVRLKSAYPLATIIDRTSCQPDETPRATQLAILNLLIDAHPGILDEELLYHGNLNLKYLHNEYTERFKGTLLFVAFNGGVQEYFDLILVKTTQINKTNQYGKTVLMIALESNNDHSVAALLARNAAVNLSDNHGKTPLMHATTIYAVNRLVAEGANINAVDNLGRSALIHGLLAPHGLLASQKRLTKTFLNNGADANIKDSSGKTALIYAATRVEITLILFGMLTQDNAIFGEIMKDVVIAKKIIQEKNGNSAQELIEMFFSKSAMLACLIKCVESVETNQERINIIDKVMGSPDPKYPTSAFAKFLYQESSYFETLSGNAYAAVNALREKYRVEPAVSLTNNNGYRM